MTSSAKARRVVVALLGIAAVGVAGTAAWWFGRAAVPAPTGVLASVHLADPVELTEGFAPVRVSRFVLDLDRRRLTLERDELAFDDYGDATRVGGAEPLTVSVRLRREGLDRFEVVLPRRFQQTLRLVPVGRPRPGETNTNTYRLVVVGADGRDDIPARVLELRGPAVVPDELGDGPPPDCFRFHALGRMDGRRGLTNIDVSGSPTAGGSLSIDPNHLSFHRDGTVGMTTCLGWRPAAVTFRPLGPDPAGCGRRAFELVPGPTDTAKHAPPFPAGTSFVLVLGPTALSPHLLLVKDGGRVRQVLTLRSTDRDNHLDMLRRLDGVPADEREAFRELGKAGGHRAIAQLDQGHVTGLHLLEGDLAKLDPILARFPHLKELGFHDATLPPTGLPSLGRLRNLTAINFYSSEVSDDGFASVGKATGLKRVILFGTKGPTAAGLAHLAPLTELDWLQLRREDEPADAPNLDDGFKHLTGLTKLTHLNVHGQRVTDAGLVHIGKLTALRELYLSGGGLTDAGLKHLTGLRLEQFTLYGQGRITPAALEAFRDTLPTRGRRQF